MAVTITDAPAPNIPDYDAIDDERVAELHTQLKPGAENAYLVYIESRTPAEWQDKMKALVDADLNPTPPAPDPNVASVTNGQGVDVLDNTDASLGNGTATVTNSVLVNVKLP